MLPQLFLQCFIWLARLQCDEDRNGLTFDLMRTTNCCCLCNRWMTYQRTFNLNCRESMAGNVKHIINPTHNPVVAVFILPCVITGKILSWNPFPIGFHKAFFITPDTTEHSWPRLCHNKPATFTWFNWFTCSINNFWTNTWQRQGATTRLRRDATGKRAHHDSASLCLPPCIDNGAAFSPYCLVVPHPCFGINTFSNSAK